MKIKLYCKTEHARKEASANESSSFVTKRFDVEFSYFCTYGNFPYLRCWQILSHSPKWANISTPSGRSENKRSSKRSKTNESGEPETPTSDARNADLNDDIPKEELPRPVGRRSQSKRPESSSMSMRTEMSNAFCEINKRLQDIHELRTKPIGGEPRSDQDYAG
ncbi:putative No apical meristem-associated domain-containing protein [Helianthus anomalus]